MSPAGPGSSPLWPAASLHAGCSRRKSNTDDFIILPSDLSGILSCSPPPPSSLPPPTDTYTLLLYILPHCISRSPCLSFHHTPSRPILPHFPAPLPTPRAFFIAKFNTHFKVKCQCVCVCGYWEVCWVAAGAAAVAALIWQQRRSDLIPPTSGALAASSAGEHKHGQSIGFNMAFLATENETQFYFASLCIY